MTPDWIDDYIDNEGYDSNMSLSITNNKNPLHRF